MTIELLIDLWVSDIRVSSVVKWVNYDSPDFRSLTRSGISGQKAVRPLENSILTRTSFHFGSMTKTGNFPCWTVRSETRWKALHSFSKPAGRTFGCGIRKGIPAVCKRATAD